MSKGKTVRVVTLPRTMSGMRAGRTLTLEPGLAKEWVEKGYVRLVTDDQESKPEATTKGKVAALLLALLLSVSSVFAAASRFEIVAQGTFGTSNSAPFQLSTSTNLFIGVDVTSCTGTPGTLDVWLQASDDGGTTWFDYPADLVMSGTGTSASRTSGTLAAPLRNITGTAGHAVTTTNKYVGVYKNIATDRIRVQWIIATFTSCLFSISAVAK